MKSQQSCLGQMWLRCHNIPNSKCPWGGSVAETKQADSLRFNVASQSKRCLKKITAVGQTFITVKLKKTFFLTFRLLWHTDNQWNNQDNLNITTLDPLRHLQRWVTPVWSFYDVFLFFKFLADLFQIWAPNWIKEEKDSGKSFTTAEIESILLFSIEHILCHTDKQRRRWSWTLNYNHRELWRFDLITVYRYRKSVFRLNVCSFWTNLWILLSLI